jgi:hypothetical protein
MLRLYAQGIAAGLGTAMAAGALLAFVRLGFFSIIGALLIGAIVGEVVSKATRRLPVRGFAVVAFVCAVLGPVVGEVLLFAVTMPVPVSDPFSRLEIAVGFVLASSSPMSLVVALAAGFIATTRVTR